MSRESSKDVPGFFKHLYGCFLGRKIYFYNFVVFDF